MIKMVQKEDILTLYRRGVSLRAIAKELRVNRATVTKYVREEQQAEASEDPYDALADVLASKPAYNQKKARPPRVLKGDVVQEIDRWLAENDRLCHKVYLVNMSGPSYRVLETKKLNEK